MAATLLVGNGPGDSSGSTAYLLASNAMPWDIHNLASAVRDASALHTLFLLPDRA